MSCFSLHKSHDLWKSCVVTNGAICERVWFVIHESHNLWWHMIFTNCAIFTNHVICESPTMIITVLAHCPHSLVFPCPPTQTVVPSLVCWSIFCNGRESQFKPGTPRPLVHPINHDRPFNHSQHQCCTSGSTSHCMREWQMCHWSCSWQSILGVFCVVSFAILPLSSTITILCTLAVPMQTV